MFDGRFRHAVDRGTKPVGTALVRLGITADVLTVIGLVMSAVFAVAVASGRLLLGAFLLIAVGLPDLLDGPVAKASGRASVRGAFLDSVADRVSDALLYGGVAWYLAAGHHGTAVLVPFALVAATSLISYQRAKAELLGLPAKGGLMERAERIIVLGLCLVAGAVSAAALVPALAVLLVLVGATAVGRFVRIWQVAEGPAVPPPAPTAWRRPAAAHGRPRRRQGRVESRWSTWREARADRLLHGVDRPVRPRRAAEPLGRWRARRAAVPRSRAGRVWRDRDRLGSGRDHRTRPPR